MNNLQTFNFERFGRVRIVVRDGEPWFVAKDVCDILGHTNVTEALRNLDEDEVSNLRISEVSDFRIPNRGINIVSESGLYTLAKMLDEDEAGVEKIYTPDISKVYTRSEKGVNFFTPLEENWRSAYERHAYLA
jgi:hypothetical protein